LFLGIAGVPVRPRAQSSMGIIAQLRFTAPALDRRSRPSRTPYGVPGPLALKGPRPLAGHGKPIPNLRPIDHLLAKPDRPAWSPATARNGAGRGRCGVVHDCPLGTSQDRCEWHGSGTAGEDDVRGPGCESTSSPQGEARPHDACLFARAAGPWQGSCGISNPLLPVSSGPGQHHMGVSTWSRVRGMPGRGCSAAARGVGWAGWRDGWTQQFIPCG
jgi:hypothetical protein